MYTSKDWFSPKEDQLQIQLVGGPYHGDKHLIPKGFTLFRLPLIDEEFFIEAEKPIPDQSPVKNVVYQPLHWGSGQFQYWEFVRKT